MKICQDYERNTKIKTTIKTIVSAKYNTVPGLQTHILTYV